MSYTYGQVNPIKGHASNVWLVTFKGGSQVIQVVDPSLDVQAVIEYVKNMITLHRKQWHDVYRKMGYDNDESVELGDMMVPSEFTVMRIDVGEFWLNGSNKLNSYFTGDPRRVNQDMEVSH